ncbi:Ig-like domain-containing protein [Nocardioides sp. SYSU D00038]|uniref:alpha-L-rhamnosidase-related protein n=1 Tax=Nocardioides sp. SYSU D00038 TaxID=2812554 RepID=UPI00196842E7|nr:Ig-like domain-containing protein [Nocardioides sp. SYSU D00038]
MAVEFRSGLVERVRRAVEPVRRVLAGVLFVALGAGGLAVVVAATAAPAQAAPPRVCGTALSTLTNKVVLLGLPASGGTGADSYSGGYLAPARASEWTDYSLEGTATTSNTLAVSFRQSGNNGPSLQFAAGQNTLGPLRLNNGGWAADGNLQLPAGTLSAGKPFRFKIAVTGQQVTVSIDDVQVAQYSRPWIPASGTVGIRVSGAETGTLDDLVVRRLDTGKYLYADDFDDRAVGTAGATAAGYAGLETVEVCSVPDSPADAYWIWSSDATSVNNWAAFRKTFTVDDVDALPERVNARIAAETKYWLYVNDELVVFEGSVKRGPNRNDTYVDNVDLRPHLQEGENTVAILAVSYGRGGYAGPYSGRAGLFFEAADVDLRSNDTWKALKVAAYGSMGVDTNYRLAEPNVRYDAREEVADWADWKQGDYDDSEWPAAVTAGNEGSSPWNLLVDRPIPLLKYDEQPTTWAVTDPAVKTTTAGGVTTYEVRLPVNQQLTPYVKLGAATEAGRTVGLKTDHATVRGSGIEQAVQAEYVTKAGAQEYESLVWMNGDKLFITSQAGAQVEEIGYRFSGYASEFDGSFTSDDPYLNKLWTMARDTLYVTMRDSYMDCPDRERSQWWGDATNELEEAFYALDPAAADLARKGITNLMGFRNGDLIPTQAPAASFSELPAQSLAAVMSFWMFYEYSGDQTALEETYQPSLAYLRTYNMAADGLLQHDHGGTWHWHDWGYNEDGRLIDTLWYYIALQSTLKSGATLGVPADDPGTTWMQERVDSIADNIDKLWVEGKGYYESTGDGRADDRANALAVYAGLADPSQYEQIRDVLVNVKKSSPYMDKYALEALYLMGYPDDAIARMKDRYAPMVNDPDHSTLWEFFAGPEQDAAGTFNHAWTGGPLTMMSRYAAGIQPVTPGFEEFAVRPQLGSLKSVQAGVHSVNGKIAVQIDAADPRLFELGVTVPEGAVGRIHLPSTVLGDIEESGSPLDESTPGVLDLSVDEATGQTVVRVEAGDYDFAVAAPPATVTLPRVGTVSPGADAAGVVKVQNTGTVSLDEVSAVVDVPGLTEPVTLTGGPVAVGETADLPFTIAVPQGMRSGSSFDAQAEVTVTYGDQQRSFTVPVDSYLRVAADVTVESVVVGERTGTYPSTGRWTATATVRNDSATAVAGRVVARSVDDVLEAGAPSALVTVPAGGSLQVPVTVHGGGEHWLPIMQSVSVDFVDRGSVLATGTSTTRIKWYGPKGQGWSTTGAGAIAGATDFVDLGDGGTGSTGNSPANVRPGPTELAHNLRWNYQPSIPVGGTNTEGGLTRRFTWARDGSWYSVDVSVPTGEPFVLSMRETADTSVASTVAVVQTRPKVYRVLVDDVLVQQVRYLMPNEGVVGNTLANYQVLVDDPAALDADGDGKVTVKYLYNGPSDGFYDPSLTDVWVSPAPTPAADVSAPTVSAAPADSTAYGNNGWITEPTTVVVDAVDDVDPEPAVRVAVGDAALAPYTDPVPVTTDGTHVVRYTATDAADNAAAEQALTVRVDTTKPVPAFGEWPTGVIREGEVPDEPACLGTDATSGVASCVQTGYGRTVGPHTITQTVVDKAGNRARATFSYVVVAVDKSELELALLELAVLDADDWTTSSWAALRSVVDGESGAQAVLDGTEFSQAQVDAAVAAVEAAVGGLVPRGDATALTTLVDAARGLADKLDGFTEASANALRAALADAEEVHEARADKTQAQLDAATEALQTALNGLTVQPPTTDKAVLQHVHDEAKVLSNDDGAFTAASWATLQAELTDAAAVLADADATQAEVDQAVVELTSAVSGLEPAPAPVSKAVLEAVLAQATGLTEASYTKDSWAALQVEVADATEVLGQASATQAEVDAATVELSAAVAGLVPAKPDVPAAQVVAKVKLNQAQLRLVRGKKLQLEEGVYLTDGRASYAGTVVWRSSNPKVATVSAAGVVKARKNGRTTISATTVGASASGAKLSTSIKVTVVKKKPKAKVRKVSAVVPSTMKVGQAVFVTGRYLPAKATGLKVTYRSSAPGVASVDVAGRILANAKGVVTITVRAGGKTQAYRVTVQ